MYRIGLDVGSTTAKIVVLDAQEKILFSKYERHNADASALVIGFLEDVRHRIGDAPLKMTVTGSVGMGISEILHLPFIQEVVSASKWVKKMYPSISTIIDIGGEDAKIVYLKPDGSADLRMNGNCAGGTGAFIDQMALILGLEVGEMNTLALEAKRIYPIASRCGVFSKTDVQNLISKNADKADIVASIFHAVAVQTMVTLSRACEIVPKILLCGGPLSFIPALREAFFSYLKMDSSNFILPDNAHLIPALGAALSAEEAQEAKADDLINLIRESTALNSSEASGGLAPLFPDEQTYTAWREQKQSKRILESDISLHTGKAYLGIDSGSTTTKIALIDEQERLLYSYYAPNLGNPILTVKNGLEKLMDLCAEKEIDLHIHGSCSTGYGEDLIKASFQLHHGIIETVAHYLAAKKINPDVSFILDIGGQDMKAIFLKNGLLSGMEINEACSSGCGSFIETFANSLDYKVADFAQIAALAKHPSDLGTRCTVFMNSKVKQVLREGATVGDIAAGLSYSVIKNCLYKVLKVNDVEEFGNEVVVQGGSMRNDSVVRAFELLSGIRVSRSSHPELMGAYGCALYAKTTSESKFAPSVNKLVETAQYSIEDSQCKGCENRCFVNKYRFKGGNVYYSGNKCEKIFSNKGAEVQSAYNASVEKNKILFDREGKEDKGEGKLILGIPRCLNMYENYPFWHTLFNECGIKTQLSDVSTFRNYEEGVHSVMSDNICFPAKLVHTHIYNLIDKKVDRIFLPYVIFEKTEDPKAVNTYNCPIVSAYSDVIKSALNPSIPVDSPIITFKDEKSVKKGCFTYLRSLGVPKSLMEKALKKAIFEQKEYENRICQINKMYYQQGQKKGRMTILLAGRPYHTDPLIQHKLSDMIADMGVDVITEDIVRHDTNIAFSNTFHVSQWAYVNRILRAAEWVATQGPEVQFMQMTSFGCGPDAFLLDEVRGILKSRGKSLTLLKIDDVNNIGSIKLRVRSLIESVKFSNGSTDIHTAFVHTKNFMKTDAKRTILLPFFTDYLSPLMPAFFRLAGYETEVLEKSDVKSAEYGLKYANNEVCYPATLVVGDIIKALLSGKYNRNELAVAITQTGGQCRASNYIALIKKAMVDAGFADVPVISISMGSGLANEQAGFKINWLKLMPIALASILYGDCLSKFYHAAVVREKHRGDALRLREQYLDAAKQSILNNDINSLYALLEQAAKEFNAVVSRVDLPKVGIVGEIFLKFNSFSHKNVVHWLIENKIEVLPPILLNFFMQYFVNYKVNIESGLEKARIPSFIFKYVYSLAAKQIQKVNRIGSEFHYFTPFSDIFTEAEHGKEVISLSAQFGEGWLLPAEIISFAHQNVHNVISLQPFGCIANHVVSKGLEKKIKMLYPQMNLLSLDFDGGVSEVNIMNRLLLFTDNLKMKNENKLYLAVDSQ